MIATHNATVFIIDDNPTICKGLGMLLRTEGLQARTFTSAREFLDQLDHNDTGCLVLDVRMPDIDGLQLQEILSRRAENLPIIFITGHGNVPMAVQAMKNGACDFLEKPFRDQALLACIHKALDRVHNKQQHDQELETFKQRLELLTPRERQVMQHVIQGKLNKMIALELGLSHKTVEIHRARCMSKLQIRSLADLVRLATRAGLL